MGIVCAVVLILSVLYGCFTGAADALSAAFFDGVKDATDFCLKTGTMLCFFCGLMRLAADCGWTKALSVRMRPLLCRLIPLQEKDHVLAQDLAMNISSNFLGLGNAATPCGIRATRCMLDMTGGIVDRSVATFLVLNTASIQFLPTTVAAIRSAHNSAQPFAVFLPILFTQACACLVGILAVRLLYRR